MGAPLSLPVSYKRTTAGPDSFWYCQDDGTPYASVAAACAAVPVGVRKLRTVNVAGAEYWWLPADLTDAGLVAKGGATDTGLTNRVTAVEGTAATNTAAIGTLANLTTTVKTSLVAALNELKALADTLRSDIGTLASLSTTAKGSLVAALNELYAAVASPKMAAPAYAATLVINPGTALAKPMEPIIATGDITSLSATLVDGAIISIPVTASGGNRSVTVPLTYVAFKTGTLRTKTIDAGTTCRVIIERLGDTYSFGFLG